MMNKHDFKTVLENLETKGRVRVFGSDFFFSTQQCEAIRTALKQAIERENLEGFVHNFIIECGYGDKATNFADAFALMKTDLTEYPKLKRLAERLQRGEVSEEMCRIAEDCEGSSTEGEYLGMPWIPENVEIIFKAMVAQMIKEIENGS
jgi:hypothetical protein